jgi:Tol biopolymer transport system component
MKIIISFVLISIAASGASYSQQKNLIDLKTVPSVLALFCPQQVSTFLNERDFAISPDGNEIYYTISTPKSGFQTIVSMHKVRDGEWTAPEVVSFAGTYSDLEPVFSPDGQTMFFASNRPVTGSEPKDFDIWKVTRTKNGWGDPVNLGSPVNTSADEFYPSVTRTGRLYFTAQYKTGVGKEDIFMADYVNGSYQIPQPLDTAVNSKLYEFNAFVAPDESYILFTSYGRKDDAGGGDLYISRKGPEGKWEPAENLKALNSKQLDYCPYVSPDGKILFLTSERHQLPVSFTDSKATYQSVNAVYTSPLNGTGNIYWVQFSALGK